METKLEQFTVRQLERSRQFYRLYPIASTLRTQLNWSQYKLLISIADKDKREYYELEAIRDYGRKNERPAARYSRNAAVSHSLWFQP